ncbi:hypothetical protein OBBRIDRAFT_888281 [Obba rivulosa]|uniref:F-box domain-containing protein n=1 Tax=Obba rivulosa TaxID=1052685 RepID=A0A8E2DL77_9APHY|nr:hypothetical protein OBBRIDRAFT_888281 [Obba rivulosa]
MDFRAYFEQRGQLPSSTLLQDLGNLSDDDNYWPGQVPETFTWADFPDAVAVDDVPDEILRLIFEAGVADDSLSYASSISRSSGFPRTLTYASSYSSGSSIVPFQVLVSHVCRRWRAAALGDSFLWRRLHIAAGHTMDEVQSYLERSGEQPLDVKIDFALDDAHRDLGDPLERPRALVPSHDVRVLAAAAARHAGRWACCTLEGFPGTSCDLITEWLDGLALLRLRCLTFSSSAPSPQLRMDAPALAHLALPLFGRSGVPAGLLHGALCTLELQSGWLDAALLRDILKACPQLHTLRLIHITILESAGLDAPSLRYLDVSGVTDPAKLLSVLHAPALEALLLIQCRGALLPTESPTGDALFPALRALCSENCNHSVEELDIMMTFSGLEHLGLAPVTLANMLPRMEGKDDIWPRLHTLHSTFEDELGLFIDSRIAAGRPLRAIYLLSISQISWRIVLDTWSEKVPNICNFPYSQHETLPGCDCRGLGLMFGCFWPLENAA